MYSVCYSFATKPFHEKASQVVINLFLEEQLHCDLGFTCSNIFEYTQSNCSNTWKRVTKALFCYFVSSIKLLITGNYGLIKVVSVYWWYLYLVLPIPIRYRYHFNTGIGISPPLITSLDTIMELLYTVYLVFQDATLNF